MAVIKCSEQFIKSAALGLDLIVKKYGPLKELSFLREPGEEGGFRSFYVDIPGKRPGEEVSMWFREENGKIVMVED
jgi:hypothetical protein